MSNEDYEQGYCDAASVVERVRNTYKEPGGAGNDKISDAMTMLLHHMNDVLVAHQASVQAQTDFDLNGQDRY